MLMGPAGPWVNPTAAATRGTLAPSVPPLPFARPFIPAGKIGGGLGPLPAVPGVVTWNPSDTSADLTFSADLLTATKNANNGFNSGARSTTIANPSADLVYFELETVVLGSNVLGIALTDGALSVGLMPGQDGPGITYTAGGAIYYWVSGASAGAGWPPAWGSTDRIGLAYKKSTHTAWLLVNGVDVGGGTPGSSGGFVIDALAANYAFVHMRQTTQSAKGHFNAASLAYLPSGFSPYDSIPSTGAVYDDTETETAAAGISETDTQTTSPTEAESVAAAATETDAQITSATEAESTVAGATETDTQTIPTTDAETAAAAVTETDSQTVVGSETESAAAAATETDQQTQVISEAESAAAAATATTAQTMPTPESETAAAADAETAAQVINVSEAESAAAATSQSAGATTYNDVEAESAAASATFVDAATIGATETEAATAADSFVVAQTETASEAETAAAADQASTTEITDATRAESVGAVDTETPGLTIGSAESETAAAGASVIEELIHPLPPVLVDVDLMEMSSRFPAVHLLIPAVVIAIREAKPSTNHSGTSPEIGLDDPVPPVHDSRRYA